MEGFCDIVRPHANKRDFSKQYKFLWQVIRTQLTRLQLKATILTYIKIMHMIWYIISYAWC